MRIVLIGLCVTSLTLGACSKRDASQEDRAADRSQPDVVASGEPVAIPEAGVRFDPPSAWPRDRYRVERKSGNDAAEEQAGAAHWVALHYQPEQPGHLEASLCRIVVLTRDQWTRIEAEAGPPIGTVIESLDAWVYIAQLPQSNPYSPGSPDGEQFDAMRLSIRDVRARFSIEGDGPRAANASDTGEL